MKKKGYLDKLINDLGDPDSSTLNKRIALWAIGNIGRTKKGGLIFPKIKWDQLSPKQQEQRINEKSYADKNRGYLPSGGWFIYKAQKPKES